MTPRTVRWAAALFAALAAVGPATAQEAPARPGKVVVGLDGTEIFRHWVHLAGFQPQPDRNVALKDPETTLVIVFGDVNFAERDSRLEAFVRAGGALLVATDQAFNLPFLDARITGRFVRVSRDEDAYRGSHDCPVVEPVPGLDAFQASSPRSIFLSLPASPVATNRPSSVVPSGWPLRRALTRTPLARFPESAYYADRDRPLNRDRDLFAVGGTLGAGRFLVLSDHSMFINRMLGRPVRDSSNNAFAQACLAWLREGPDGPRGQCLFYEDGVPQPRFALPTPKVPVPPFDALANAFLHHGNTFLAELEEKDWLNEVLLDRLGLHGTVRFVLVLLTVVLVVYGLFRLWNARTGPDPGVTMAAQAAEVVPRGSAVRQRHAAQLASGNLYEIGRERVRQQFRFVDGAEPAAGGAAPRVVVSPGVPQARRLRKEAERLWRIGYGPAPVPVPRREWARFNQTLERVVRAWQDGRWRFESPADRT